MVNPLAGKPLRYLIGADNPGHGADDVITEVPYENGRVKHGVSIGYCNLFDEENSGEYGPYLKTSDTASKYGEGQIDPRGQGWLENLIDQFTRRRHQGFEYIELDNPDAYDVKDVIGAIELAAKYGLKVIAKNPHAMAGGAIKYIEHPNIYGIIVEQDDDVAPRCMDQLRRTAGKPDLPIWFVAFGSGRPWAVGIAQHAMGMRNLGVTFSRHGEYKSSEDILRPHA